RRRLVHADRREPLQPGAAGRHPPPVPEGVPLAVHRLGFAGAALRQGARHPPRRGPAAAHRRRARAVRLRRPAPSRRARAPRRLKEATRMNATWRCTLAATALIALALGSRSAFGLFVSPINTATGIGLAGISLAVAIGQLVQGVAQPVVGVLADRYGAARVIALGLVLFAVGNAATIVSGDALAFGTAVVFTAAAATAMSSIAVLLAEVGRRVPPARQALAIGIVGAGGSLGQWLAGPGTQAVIDAAGWQAALWSTAGLALLALPLALVFRRGAGVPAAAQAAAGGDGPDRSEALAAREDGTRHAARRERHPGVAGALRSRDFWLIGAGFAACGMHIAFLNLHMPGVIDGCGLPAG